MTEHFEYADFTTDAGFNDTSEYHIHPTLVPSYNWSLIVLVVLVSVAFNLLVRRLSNWITKGG